MARAMICRGSSAKARNVLGLMRTLNVARSTNSHARNRRHSPVQIHFLSRCNAPNNQLDESPLRSLAEHGLSEDEYQIILDRSSAAWPNLSRNSGDLSRHVVPSTSLQISTPCTLRQVLTKSGRCIQGPGENAGVDRQMMAMRSSSK